MEEINYIEEEVPGGVPEKAWVGGPELCVALRLTNTCRSAVLAF